MNKLERRKALGKWLKVKREEVKLTQAGLAKALGYDNAQIISNIERGVSAIPQKRIPDFAQSLKCEPMELDFRVLSSSVRDEGASKASELALKFFPFLNALNHASPEQVDQIISSAASTLGKDARAIAPYDS